MKLSESGKIAKNFWLKIPDHFPLIELDEFIIMPNHIHGIISIISNSDSNIVVETMHASFLQTNIQNPTKCCTTKSNYNCDSGKTRISPKPGSLGAIVGSYKSAVSKIIHRFDPDFKWQPRFYDHIIRSDSELSRIRKYIRENPGNWINKRRPGFYDWWYVLFIVRGLIPYCLSPAVAFNHYLVTELLDIPALIKSKGILELKPACKINTGVLVEL